MERDCKSVILRKQLFVLIIISMEFQWIRWYWTGVVLTWSLDYIDLQEVENILKGLVWNEAGGLFFQKDLGLTTTFTKFGWIEWNSTNMMQN